MSQGSSSSGTSATHGVAKDFFCECGYELMGFTAQTNKRGNRGKRFWRCQNYNGNNSCGYFQWFDEMMPRRFRRLFEDKTHKMESLTREIEKCTQQMEGLNGKERKYESEVAELKGDVRMYKLTLVVALSVLLMLIVTLAKPLSGQTEGGMCMIM